MKITAFFLLTVCLHVSANSDAQTITLREKNAPLTRIFKAIREQTHYAFFFNEALMDKSAPVSIDVKKADLKTVLDFCFRDQLLTYTIIGDNVVIKEKEVPQLPLQVIVEIPPIDIHGRITDSLGYPLVGASVTIKGTNKGTATNSNGDFVLTDVPENAILIVSYTGFVTRQVKIKNDGAVNIFLNKLHDPLDEVQVIAYGTVSKRFNTGNVSTVNSETIEKQPVSDPLAALEGRVPGLLITQGNGVAGSQFKVQIRGQNSIAAGTDPYYVVDGVPFNSTPLNDNVNYTGLTTANGFTSPFNSLDPEDIESVTILKDADATSIYGSRGANGVILITTKKGKSGKLRGTLNIYSGIENNMAYSKMLNTPEYLELRHNAFDNDGRTPTAANAMDLLAWDKTKYTDWQKYVTGKTAPVTDAQASVSGGNENIRFLFSLNYRNEESVYRGDFDYKRYGGHLSTDFNSQNLKFGGNVIVTYSKDENILPPTEQDAYYNLPPDFPLHDSTGALYWTPSNSNPLAYSQLKTNYQTSNLVLSSQLYYKLLPDLTIRSNFGYTTIDMQQLLVFPAQYQNPAFSPVNYSQFGEGSNQSWIIEPQIDYSKIIGSGKLQVLVGGTWQDNLLKSYNYTAQFQNDELMEFIGSASSIYNYYNTYAEYKYASLFGRINYNLLNRYLLTLSFRRDGSSRFGPDKQYGNFGSVAAAWIFSDESFIKNNLSFLSFGKIRSSYGITGNDQIPNYQYLSTYSSNASTVYGDINGLQPVQAANPDFSWENNKKFEIAIELGFHKDRILLSSSWYENRSSNQLINYPLAIQSGFSGYQANLPAIVENEGWEFDLSTVNIKNNSWTWNSSVVLTIPQNKLLQFPGLAGTSFANLYEIGQPLSIVKGFHFLGINPADGTAQFLDVNKDGMISDPEDMLVMGKRTPDYYGGLNNSVTYKGFEFSFFFQFVKQMGYNNNFLSAVPPGYSRHNAFVTALDRWQNPGDITSISAASTTAGTPIFNAFTPAYGSSDAAFSDASYIRLKNISLVYHFPKSWLLATGLEECRVYLMAQNLLTISHYFGFDPETLYKSVGPLRAITAGIHVTF